MDEMPPFQVEEVVQETGMARTLRTRGPIILIVVIARRVMLYMITNVS